MLDPLTTAAWPAQSAPLVAGLTGLACALNLLAAWRAGRAGEWGRAAVWTVLAGGFAGLTMAAGRGVPLEIPAAAKRAIDGVLGPVSLTLGSATGLTLFYAFRRAMVHPGVAWTACNASWLLLALSLPDAHFAAIVLRPDNVPIVALAYLVAFFTWLATRQAVINDDRLARGEGPVEADFRQRVLVWPDVMYLELLLAVIGSVILIAWSLALRAPLEQPADPMLTPNPAKAPWYFLGLQEMLVYFAPWMAGVMLPLLIILGLMAIPYLDVNPRGNGYYTIRQRRFAWLVFQFGFLELWILLIFLGVFFRGPNWSFFGLYEPHDPHKITVETNVSLAELAATWRGSPSPAIAPRGLGAWGALQYVVRREACGLGVLAMYYLAVPLALRWTVLREFRRQMGRGRFWIMTFLLLTMLLLPLKMLLYWTWHLNYLVNVPEYFFYF